MTPSASHPADLPTTELWNLVRAVGHDLDRCVERLGDANTPWTESDAEQVDALVIVVDDLRARSKPAEHVADDDNLAGLAALYEAPLAVDGLVEALDELEHRARTTQEQAWERAGRPIPLFMRPSPVLAPVVDIKPLEVGLVEVPLEGPDSVPDDEPAAGESESAHDADDDDPEPGRRVDRWGVVVEVLTVVGVMVLVFVVYAVWGTGLSAAQSQRQLEREFNGQLRASVSLGAGAVQQDSGILGGPTSDEDAAEDEADEDAEAAPVVPDLGDPVAMLDLPTIGSRQIVVEGTRAGDITVGPGHLRSTPQPGRAGNAVLFGRRTTYGRPFARLDELRPGDPMDVVTTEGKFRYVVQQVRVVGSGDPDPIGATFSNRLTLVTSDDKYATTGRLVVIGLLEGAPVPTPIDVDGRPLPVPFVKPDEFGTERTTADVALAIVFTQALVAAYFGTKWLYRSWLPWSTWLVSAPVFILVALLWLDSVTRLLPSTL